VKGDVQIMWDQTIETTIDQRGRPVPPVLVRASTTTGAASPPAMNGWRIAATGPNRTVLTEAIAIIRAAKQVVVFSSFLLSDGEVQKALVEASSRGCRVYGLIAAEAKLDRDVSDEDDFEAKTTESHKRMLNDFAGRMLIRSSPSFHAKCVLADPATDGARGLLLTANLTSEALTRNEELAVRLGVVETRELFDQLRYATWEVAERELVGKGQLDRVKPLGEVTLPPPARHVITTMGGRCQIRDTMIEMIGAARKGIVVSSFGWDAEHPVVAALCKRSTEGVPVTVLARYRATALPALLKLRKAGATVFCFTWLHAKALVCDDQAMVMSANLQKHGLDDGFELGIRMTGSDTDALRGVLKAWSDQAPWRLEIPATLGDVAGDIVPLTPTAIPKKPEPTIRIKPTETLTLEAVTARSADRLEELKMSEASLRQEVEKRGLTWVQQILVRYSIRAPRVPASAKREERSKGSKEGESSGTAGPRVYRLPDGSKAMGIGTPDEAKAARAMADSLGIRTILVEEIAS
jgi:cardiolipin synthase